MTCSRVKIGGTWAFICGPTGRGRIQACVACGEIASKLCDWKLESGKTCDAPLCDNHAHPVAKNRDLCPDHAQTWAGHPANKQRTLPLFSLEEGPKK